MKVSSQAVAPPTLKIKSTYPFQLVAADLVQFPRTSRGNIGCLVIVDHYSKWISVVPIRNKTAQTVWNTFEHRILPTLLRVPDRILTDNGPEFASSVFLEGVSSYGINHISTTPYKPSSNGCVERVNRTITQFLRSITDSPGLWDLKLAKAVVVYNHTKHSEIKISPAELLLTRSHEIGNVPILSSGAVAV